MIRKTAFLYVKMIILFENQILFDLETSWTYPLIFPKWIIFGSKGIIYENKNKFIIKFYKSNEISKYKNKNEYSYLSNEKIKWKYKTYSLNTKNKNYHSINYYNNLIASYKDKKKYKKIIDSTMNTLKFIDKFIK